MMGRMWRGTALGEALRKYSDPEAVRALEKLESQLKVLEKQAGPIGPDGRALEQQIFDMRRALEDKFIRWLHSGLLQASGLQMPLTPMSYRQPICEDLWPLLDVNFPRAEADGKGLRLIDVQVLAPMMRLPHEKSKPLAPKPEFEFEADFSRVRIRDAEFELGPTQGNVIRLLWEAAHTENPWRNGKELMGDAGANSVKIGDLFKRDEAPSWRELIEGKGDGRYRLNLKTPIAQEAAHHR